MLYKNCSTVMKRIYIKGTCFSADMQGNSPDAIIEQLPLQDRDHVAEAYASTIDLTDTYRYLVDNYGISMTEAPELTEKIGRRQWGVQSRGAARRLKAAQKSNGNLAALLSSTSEYDLEAHIPPEIEIPSEAMISDSRRWIEEEEESPLYKAFDACYSLINPWQESLYRDQFYEERHKKNPKKFVSVLLVK